MTDLSAIDSSSPGGEVPAAGRERLAPDERRAWEEDGFFLREAVFDATELAALRRAAEAAALRAERALHAGRLEGDYEVDGNRYLELEGSTVQLEHRPGTRTLRVIEPFHHLHPLLDALLDDPRLVEPMRDLVGSSRIALWTDKLNLKRPREGSGFRFHQDSPYWSHVCQDVERLPNVMIALDDATPGNGCLHVVRGSHRKGFLPGLRDGSVLGPLFTDPAGFDAAEAVPAAMPAGSLLFFHPHTVHGSQPNRSDRARRAMVLTYQPADRRTFKRDVVRNAGEGSRGAVA